jgi:RNA polymerase sigma-70 factor (ECF subfamily)
MPEASGSELDMLAERAAKGDSDAFAELARALVPDWYRIATHLIDDPTSVEDVVQDITLKVYLALPKWNRDAGVRTWTYRIAVNAGHDARRAMRHASRALPLESASNIASPATAGAMTDDPFVRDAIARSVSQLPSELAAVVSLRYGADLGFAEIARVLAIPQGTVSTRLRRALTLLGKALAPTLGRKDP